MGMIPLLLHAQVIINPQLPPAGMMQKEQLWNLTIINNKDNVFYATVKLTLQDAHTGQVMMSASTSAIILNKGVMMLSNTDVQPVSYDYNSGGFANNFLPLGNYIACYEIYYPSGEAQVLLSSECIRLNIDPLSPPLLNIPVDKSKIQTPYPLFNWMPPTPVDMFSDLNYDIIVTEVLGGQSPAEAIEYNTPVYTNTNLTQPNQSYPASFSKLDTGKIYAWQVIAKNGFSYLVKTEVWTFSVYGDSLPAITPPNDFYLLLEDDLKGTYFISKSLLHIKYASFDKEHTAPVIFSDQNGVKVYTVDKPIVQGDNYFDINLKNNFQKGIIYSVSITDMAGKSQSLLFSIK
jgi:hypothetical protein